MISVSVFNILKKLRQISINDFSNAPTISNFLPGIIHEVNDQSKYSSRDRVHRQKKNTHNSVKSINSSLYSESEINGLLHH